MPLDDLPPAAQAAWSDLRDRLRSLLGNDLVAMWAHGGTTSIGDPPHVGDLDTYVFVARQPDEATVRRIQEAHQATADEHGIEWDAWYVLIDAARGVEPPPHAWQEGRRDTSWAINRAYWLAGRYVTLHGVEPRDLVTTPTWGELSNELDRELEHIERHVLEGDTDAFEATYAILNGCRILRALDTRDVVISKRAAGTWALEHLATRWHDAVGAALRSYDGRGGVEDGRLLAAEMAPFVGYVRERLPPTSERGPDVLPRWSGN